MKKLSHHSSENEPLQKLTSTLNTTDFSSDTPPSVAAAASSAGSGTGGATPNADLMRQAREALTGNWGWSILGGILYVLLVSSVGSFFGALAQCSSVLLALPGVANLALFGCIILLQVFLVSVLEVGIFNFYLLLVQDGECRLDALFSGFKRFWTVVFTCFFYNVLIFFWVILTLLLPGLIVLGISYFTTGGFSLLNSPVTAQVLAAVSSLGVWYAVLRYSMVFFILFDEPSAGPFKCIMRSSRIMKGNKWKLFCLYCRFIGWILLCSFTCGVGFLWLFPYGFTSFASFYEDVK